MGKTFGDNDINIMIYIDITQRDTNFFIQIQNQLKNCYTYIQRSNIN